MKTTQFLIGLVVGILLAVAISIFAWTNPSSAPTSANGALYTNSGNIVIDKNLIISTGEMQLGDNDHPSGIEMYDSQNGQKGCLQITSGAVDVKPGACP